jgi:biofilm PGA synthesis lipoprotein PgaB
MDRRTFLKAAATAGATVLMGSDGSLQTPGHPWSIQIPPGEFVALCMHDVREDVAPRDRDPYAISTRRLAAFFDWMRHNGWHPVSLAQVLQARSGGPTLPANAVLLTWDDGLASAYTEVFPLLRAFGYPGLFALETGWLTRVARGLASGYQDEGTAQAKADTVHADGHVRGTGGFLSWDHAREMLTSGLATFASHTNDLHHGLLANPQGNVEPAALTRAYLADPGRYETDPEYTRRISLDLEQSAALIQKELGVRPLAVVWPYGAVNPEMTALARQAGYQASFSLSDWQLNPVTGQGTYGRLLVMGDPGPVAIEAQVGRSLRRELGLERAVQVDMDYLYDPSPARVNDNLGRLLDRIQALQVRTVYLQAFADPQGTGAIQQVYFPNPVLPMRADLFNRVAWMLRARANVRVFAWMPLLAFQLPNKALQDRLAVKVQVPGGGRLPSRSTYPRLSPFLPESLERVGGLYAALAKNQPDIQGVLIHDDATLGVDEDATVLGSEARWPGTSKPMDGTMLSPREKTEALIAFGEAVTDRMRPYLNLNRRFECVRNLYARVVLDPAAEARFAQALGPFLATYHWVVLMAMPYLDGTEEDPGAWLDRLVHTVARTPGALEKVVFELQTRDWRTGTWIPGSTLERWMKRIVELGGASLAYYPDDFLGNHPPFTAAFVGMSLRQDPVPLAHR